MIIHTVRCPIIVAEIKFRSVTVQVLLAAVLIHALHAALEDAVEAFDRVGVNFSATVFALTVSGKVMLCELFAKVAILTRFVGVNGCLAVYVLLQDRN